MSVNPRVSLKKNYDNISRLTQATSAGSVAVTQKYLYDGDDIVAILDSNNAVIATITHDESIDTPLSITNANGTFYYHRDHQGSIVALTDSSGAVVESFTYDNHYGTITNHTKTTETNNPYAYTGRELDTDELYYYRARYYDPTLQRFVSEDLIGFSSGDTNFYRYVWSVPNNYRDPDGKFGVPGAIAGAVTGAVMSFYNPCTGGLSVPSFGDLFKNMLLGGVGGFFGGFFAGSGSALGTLGGLGADLLINTANYANASSCQPNDPCQ